MTSNNLPSDFEWITALANTVSRLSAEQLGDLAIVFDSSPVQEPSAGLLQRALHIPTVDASQLVRALEQILRGSNLTGRDLSIALEAFAQMRMMEFLGHERVEVVCTAPSRFGVPVRSTFAAAVQLVQAARKEILVVGYVFTEGARSFVEYLAAARRDRGVQVTIIGNELGRDLHILRSIWPTLAGSPTIFSRQTDRRDDTSILHAKLLVSDGVSALVTSANFSYHGLHQNIEIGLKVQSSAVAQLVEFIRSMIANGEVEAIDWPP